MKRTHEFRKTDWQLARSPQNDDKPDWDDTVPASVPGSLLMDLFAAGIVPKPHNAENFRACAWTAEWTFWYRLVFAANDLSDLADDYDRLVLHFESIDTYSEVFLNGTSLGSTLDQFLRYDFDITDLFDRSGSNELVIRIDPPKPMRKKWLAENGIDKPETRALFDSERPYIRKAQMSFGWDNCPHLIAGGIPLPLWIESFKGACLADVVWNATDVDAGRNTAKLHLKGSVDGDVPAARVQVSGECDGHSFRGEAEVADNEWHLSIDVDDAKLWWPHTHGDPNLYKVSVQLLSDAGLVDEVVLKVGLREVRIVTDPASIKKVDYTIGQEGKPMGLPFDIGEHLGPWERKQLDEPVEVESRPFYITVNGRNVFAKGADWEPSDVLVSNVSEERLTHLVEKTVEANMNVLRIWGGGIVEKKLFYDLCSEKGILVWQDFFFGCCVYPRNEPFLELLKPEVEDIVKRLTNHTCLFVWCGDNESDMIEFSRGKDPEQNPITRKIIPGALEKYDFQNRFYQPSSPYGGPYPRSDFAGDKRNWGPRFPNGNFWHIKQEESTFVSESGSRALPDIKTVYEAFPEGQRWPIDNRMWRLHTGDLDHAIRGDYVVEQIAWKFFQEPTNVEEAVVISQFANAWGTKYLVERCRQRKYDCGGILIWKMGDQWPCHDYGLIDYNLYPRMVYDWTKKAFEPVIAFIQQDWRDTKSDLQFWVSNDRQQDVAGKLSVKELLIEEDGSVTSESELWAQDVSVPADTSQSCGTQALKDYDVKHVVFSIDFVAADKSVSYSTTYTLDPRAAYLYHVAGGRGE